MWIIKKNSATQNEGHKTHTNHAHTILEWYTKEQLVVLVQMLTLGIKYFTFMVIWMKNPIHMRWFLWNCMNGTLHMEWNCAINLYSICD